jgi:hypothetical protein
MLLVVPGKLTVDCTASLVLSTIATELLVSFSTNVKALLGERAIIPAFGREDKSTVEGESTSAEASTILSAGLMVPRDVVDNGFETNARNPSLLGTFGLLTVVLGVLGVP